MKFGPIPVAQALGAVLAHTHRLPGRVLKKGSILDASALDALHQAGRTTIVAAALEPGDVPEDEAADRLADRLDTPGLRRTRASTGRVNLVAERAGLLRVDAPAIHALNATSEALTLATLPDWSSVAPGEMVATVKIIPFAADGRTLDRAAAALHAPLRLHPYRPRTVGLVMSRLPGLKDSILEGTADATRDRVQGLGGTFLAPLTCDHTSPAIAASLRALMEQGADLLLVAGASAVVDRRDVGPEGIVAAGGAIDHFGMPVDPGNLICLGHIGPRPAIVLPGCARSPKLNGIDWVLQRLFAGLVVDGPAIAAMGVGGLLVDASPRPLPRARLLPPAAILLAAGRSSRMAPHHKLLIPGPDGRPMVARAADALLASGARPIIVVLGHRAEEVRAALGDRPLGYTLAPDYAQGLSASLRAGLAALPPDTPAALVALADMPGLDAPLVDALIAAHADGAAIVAPTHQGQLGNPVLWDRAFFPAIAQLEGDRGARPILEAHRGELRTLEQPTDACLIDVDAPEQLGLLMAQA